MMLSNIILTLICLLSLSREYRGTKGSYRKAKIWHSITSIILILNTAYSVKNIETLFVHNNLVVEKYRIEIGMLSPLVQSINFYYDLILSIIIFINTFFIMNRIERARKYLIILMIMIVPSSTISFYELQIPARNFNNISILIIGLLIYILFFGGIALIYKSKFMIEFFSQKEKII